MNNSMGKFTLKCKDVDVAEFSYDERQGIEIHDVLASEYLPVLIQTRGYSRKSFDQWMSYRNIPKTRRNLAELLETYGVEDTMALSMQNLGLSLSDSYWFCPVNSGLAWEAVNLYQNDFMGATEHEGHSDENWSGGPYHPDSTSNGDLEKHWCIEAGKRMLYKASVTPYCMEAYSEVFASRLLDALGISHVVYNVMDDGMMAYSVCEAFTSPDIEFVPAYFITEHYHQLPSAKRYPYLLRQMEKLEIPVNEKDLQIMLAFDCLISNSDRHLGNFGFLRNVEDLEFIGMAPLFDNGTSMWGTSLVTDISLRNQKAKPFYNSHDKQMDIVKEGLELFEHLTDDFLLQLVQDVYSQNHRINETRIEKMGNMLTGARNKLAYLQKKNSRRAGNGR